MVEIESPDAQYLLEFLDHDIIISCSNAFRL